MDVHGPANYRQLVVGVDSQVLLPSGLIVTPINFDNAATTPPLVAVVNELVNFSPLYASVHRGVGKKEELTQQRYESARSFILNYFKADCASNTLIFVKNTTDGINKLAYRLHKPGKKSVIITTAMEHHSNDLPWRNKYQTEYVATDLSGRLLLDDLEHKLRKHRGAVRLVSVTGASNVTGYINPVHKVAELAHQYGAQVHVDGAQLVPHFPLDMRPMDSPGHIDYLTFSAHKMYAPFGVGALIGPKLTFNRGQPEYVGGGTVQKVTRTDVIWGPTPHKDEAGTPNVMGVIALAAAIKIINSLGMERLYEHENRLANYTLAGLQQINGIKLYTYPIRGEPRLGIIPFNIIGIDHQVTAEFLAREAGISVRNGCFCAQPYVRRLLGISDATAESPMPGMVRVSFGMYNQFEEIDRFLQAVRHLVNRKSPYQTPGV